MIKHRYPSLGIYGGAFSLVSGLPWGGSELSYFKSASPAVANGDWANTSPVTSPDGFSHSISSTGVPIILSMGSTARQSVPLDVYNLMLRSWYGPVIDFINDQPPAVDPVAHSFAFIRGLPISDMDISLYASDPEGDAITITTASTLPPGLALASNVLTGTPTLNGTYSVVFNAADFIGQSTNLPAWSFTVADVPMGDPVSDSDLQALLDPQGNNSGIRLVRRSDTTTRTTVSYYVVPEQTNPGNSKWVECLITDDLPTRAAKIVAATTIQAQPMWPLPGS